MALRLRTRLGLGFATVLGLLLLVSAVGLAVMLRLSSTLHEIASVENAKLVAAMAMRDAAVQQQVEMLRLRTATRPLERKQQLARIDAQAQRFDEIRQQFTGLLEGSGRN